MKSKVEFLKKLPSKDRLAETLGFKPEKFLVIYDRHVKDLPEVKKWLREFQFRYPVRAGESLKDLSEFPEHVKKIFRLVSPFSARGLCVVALGGGTVGDFAGFLASILKRGVPLVHVPTTLLSAMDSAHGGKTALNVREFKNQVGTFYPADAVMIVRGIFDELPDLQIHSAVGEMTKMALIEGGELFQSLQSAEKVDLEFLWAKLPKIIDAKYKWVESDPREIKGERQTLNLGHTLGHALEGYYELPHGVAVAEGLIFAVQWSQHQGYLSASAETTALEVLIKLGFLPPRVFVREYRSMSRSRLQKFISEDKKMTDTRSLNFIFLEGIGAPFRKKVTIESFLTETHRQGWTHG